jgi:putative phosphoesterase
MKLLIASDIHGSLSATRHVVAAFEKENADYLVFLGDVMYHGPRNPLPDEYHPAGVAELLNTVKDKVIAVRGNCDSEVDQMLLDFPITAEYQNIPLSSGKLVATHGHIFDPTPNLTNIPENVGRGDIFAFGHIHLPILEVNDSGILVLNPGSAALPKENHPPTYAIISDVKVEIKTFDEAVYRTFSLS